MFVLPERPGTVVHIKHVIVAVTLLNTFLALLFVRWLAPGWKQVLLAGALPGLLAGLGLAFAYSKNQERKRLIGNVVRRLRARARVCAPCVCVFVQVWSRVRERSWD